MKNSFLIILFNIFLFSCTVKEKYNFKVQETVLVQNGNLYILVREEKGINIRQGSNNFAEIRELKYNLLKFNLPLRHNKDNKLISNSVLLEIKGKNLKKVDYNKLLSDKGYHNEWKFQHSLPEIENDVAGKYHIQKDEVWGSAEYLGKKYIVLRKSPKSTLKNRGLILSKDGSLFSGFDFYLTSQSLWNIKENQIFFFKEDKNFESEIISFTNEVIVFDYVKQKSRNYNLNP